MRLGFYSELARRNVVAARAFIAKRGYARTAEDIRRCRQDLLASGDPALRKLAEFRDFFSISECRDLLFHVQEHRLTIPEIKAFLAANNLEFVGLSGDVTLSNVGEQFVRRFPGTSFTDLDAWHMFETENPDTFASMYQFWIRKSGEA